MFERSSLIKAILKGGEEVLFNSELITYIESSISGEFTYIHTSGAHVLVDEKFSDFSERLTSHMEIFQNRNLNVKAETFVGD